MYTLQLQAIDLMHRYPDGKTAEPTPKSATADDRMSQLAEECNRRFLATRKTTKPFPAAVKTERNQPRILTHPNSMDSMDKLIYSVFKIPVSFGCPL